MSVTPEKRGIVRMLDVAGRVVLSAAAACALLLAITFAALRSGIMGGRARGDTAQGRPHPRPLLSVSAGEPRRFWPSFPGSGEVNHREMVIDGEETVSEQWETTASAAEVLDYYREQMASRGWRDVTESALGLDPETQVLGGEKNSLQNEAYLRIYEDKMESTLVLSKVPWSMQVDVTPGSNPRQRSVSLFAVSDPSVQDFSGRLAGRLSAMGAGVDEGAALESSEQSGGTTYRTTMRGSDKPPAVFFSSMLRELRKQGWAPRIELPAKNSVTKTSEKFALLEGKEGYACLVVTPKPGGGGSSAVFTRAVERGAGGGGR